MTTWRERVKPDALREDDAAPAPWTYHHNGHDGMHARDWIEDANGNIVKENIGHIDGPRIVRAINEMATRDGILS